MRPAQLKAYTAGPVVAKFARKVHVFTSPMDAICDGTALQMSSAQPLQSMLKAALTRAGIRHIFEMLLINNQLDAVCWKHFPYEKYAHAPSRLPSPGASNPGE